MNNVTATLIDTVDEFIEHSSTMVNWLHQLVAGKWSSKEVLGHLIDSAYINLQRFVRCTYESDFTLTYAQDDWVAAQCYRDANIDELLILWKLVNKQIVTTLNNYRSDNWQAICNSHTAEFLANDYVDHIRHHLAQIKLL